MPGCPYCSEPFVAGWLSAFGGMGAVMRWHDSTLPWDVPVASSEIVGHAAVKGYRCTKCNYLLVYPEFRLPIDTQNAIANG